MLTPKRLRVKVRDKWYAVDVQDVVGSIAKVLVDGESVDVDIEGIAELERRSRPQTPVLPATPDQRIETLSAPLPGIIVSVSVRAGEEVSRGDRFASSKR